MVAFAAKARLRVEALYNHRLSVHWAVGSDGPRVDHKCLASLRHQESSVDAYCRSRIGEVRRLLVLSVKAPRTEDLRFAAEWMRQYDDEHEGGQQTLIAAKVAEWLDVQADAGRQ